MAVFHQKDKLYFTPITFLCTLQVMQEQYSSNQDWCIINRYPYLIIILEQNPETTHES